MPIIRLVNCEYCGKQFETTNTRKRFCNKQHADRSRNGVYSQPEVVTWDRIEDLRHFGKLNQEAKHFALLGEMGFSVVCYDIEATHLKANVGRILCASFKPLGGEVYTFDAHQKKFWDKDVYDDSKLAFAIRDEIEKYDICVGWNSTSFDTRFINARCIRVGGRVKDAQYQVDGMWSWRSKTAAWSGLQRVQQFLGTETEKTAIAWAQWMRALGWNKQLREEAMAEIIEHCEKDVLSLEEVYRMMVNANVVRSIRKDGGVI